MQILNAEVAKNANRVFIVSTAKLLILQTYQLESFSQGLHWHLCFFKKISQENVSMYVPLVISACVREKICSATAPLVHFFQYFQAIEGWTIFAKLSCFWEIFQISTVIFALFLKVLPGLDPWFSKKKVYMNNWQAWALSKHWIASIERLAEEIMFNYECILGSLKNYFDTAVKTFNIHVS